MELDSIYEDHIASNNFYLLLSKLKNPHYNQKNEYRTYITKLKILTLIFVFRIIL